MDKVLYAGGLEIVHAGWGSCHDEHCTTIEILECGYSIFSILIVARAEDNDICTCCQCSVNTFFDSLETEVVDNLVASTSKEVAAELRTGLAHGEIANGEHECFWSLAALLNGNTEVFEVSSETCSRNLL